MFLNKKNFQKNKYTPKTKKFISSRRRMRKKGRRKYFKLKKGFKHACMLFKDNPFNLFYKKKQKKCCKSLNFLFFNFLFSAQIHLGNSTHIELIHIVPNTIGHRQNVTIFNLNIFLITFKKVLNLLCKLYYYRKTVLINTVRTRNKLPSFIVNNLSGTNNVLTTKNRWVGGTLTNFVKIQKSTRKNLLRKNMNKLSKKFRYRIATRNLLRKKQFLAKFPQFFISLVQNHTGLNEALNLGLKTTQICDSDYDDLFADFNLFISSSIPSLLFIVYMITESIREIKKTEMLFFLKHDDKNKIQYENNNIQIKYKKKRIKKLKKRKFNF